MNEREKVIQMNLNEKCLLKYLTNPISIFSQDNEQISNIKKIDNFNVIPVFSYLNNSNDEFCSNALKNKI